MRSKHLLLILTLIIVGPNSQAQDFKLSEYATFSVLTCAPGTDLYASFGHSALRVQDPLIQLDIIYNYGIFDFYAPNFYSNFVKGKLTYTLGRQYYSDFLFEYEMENRGVKEQLLRLDKKSRDRLFNFLEKNYRPENRDYAYDFFYNNCATKLRDLIENQALIPAVETETSSIGDKTFRHLIAENLPANGWAMFGINLALGSSIDQYASKRAYQFLPKYLSESLEKTSIRGLPIVEKERMAFEASPQNSSPDTLYQTPAFASIMILLIAIIISVLELFSGRKLLVFDSLLFTASALGGLLLLFLWFLTDHQATMYNYNLLWCSPLAIAVLWLKLRPRNKGISKISFIGCVLFLSALLLTPLIHFTGIQELDALFFPIIVALWIRSVPLALERKLSK